jgi:hypothetical protein
MTENNLIENNFNLIDLDEELKNHETIMIENKIDEIVEKKEFESTLEEPVYTTIVIL